MSSAIWRSTKSSSASSLTSAHWLLYRQDTRRMRVDLEEAEEVLTIGKERIGYANVTRRFHDRKPSGKLAHR